IAATRPDVKSAPEAVKKGVTRGGSDRAANVLLRAARAHAYAEGRDVVLPEDVKAVAHWVLDHRVILTFEAEANTTPEAVVEEVLKTTPVIVKK
ncbi:MAG TPA: hypothetical protein VNI01_04715, partial [Elusimicrobiota bacterium]|nr:hypothetical protein [Elusimicrobiota bacterium]